MAEAEAETTEAEEEAVRTATAPSVQRSPSLAPTDVVGSPVLSLTSSEPGDDESGDALGGGTTSDDDSGAAIGGGTKRRTSRIVESDEDGDDEPAGAATTFAPRRPGMRGEATRDIARAKRQAEHSTGRSEARPRQQSAVFDDMSELFSQPAASSAPEVIDSDGDESTVHISETSTLLEIEVLHAVVAQFQDGKIRLAQNTRGTSPVAIAVTSAQRLLKSLFVDACIRLPGVWLPLDAGIFNKLLATPLQDGVTRAGVNGYCWTGKLEGGIGMELPHCVLETIGFSRGMLRCCMQSPAKPQDCTRVGAAAPMGSRCALTSLPSLAVANPVVQYQQGTEEACVTCCAASALWYLEDCASAQSIHRLTQKMLLLPPSINRVEWVRRECNQQLQSSWMVLSLPRDFDPFCEDALADYDAVVIQLLDSQLNLRHCIALTCDGWLFNSNRPRALPLSRSGLDECCLGGASFSSVYDGFALVRTSACKRAGNGTVSGDSKRSRHRPPPQEHMCMGCKAHKPRNDFSKNQLAKGSRARCSVCVQDSDAR